MWILDAALVENMKQRIKYKYKYPLAADVEESLENLQTEVEKLQLLLEHFIGYSFDSDHGKEILNQLREILDEAEDAVDSTFPLEPPIRSGQTPYLVYEPKDHEISNPGERMECICRKLIGFNERIRKMTAGFAVQERPQEIAKLHQPKNSSRAFRLQVEDDRVIGFDRAAEKMVDLLTRGPKSLVVISVVGMLGLGKTTLAKMVYDDPEVNYEYKIRAFVYVTRGYGPYDKKEVFVNILNSLTQGDDSAMRRMDAEDLKKHVHQQLEGKQYLIVLDNVCEWEGWDVLKDAFPKNEDKRCRVLITTRDPSVASYGCPIIKLEFLHAEASRELLRWRVFGKNNCPMEVLEYEEEIVKKCDGLPLSNGGSLSNEEEVELCVKIEALGPKKSAKNLDVVLKS